MHLEPSLRDEVKGKAFKLHTGHDQRCRDRLECEAVHAAYMSAINAPVPQPVRVPLRSELVHSAKVESAAFWDRKPVPARKVRSVSCCCFRLPVESFLHVNTAVQAKNLLIIYLANWGVVLPGKKGDLGSCHSENVSYSKTLKPIRPFYLNTKNFLKPQVLDIPMPSPSEFRPHS